MVDAILFLVEDILIAEVLDTHHPCLLFVIGFSA